MVNFKIHLQIALSKIAQSRSVRVLASAKVATTEDPAHGVEAAVRAALGAMPVEEIAAVLVGTTRERTIPNEVS